MYGSNIMIQPEDPNFCTSQKADDLSQADSLQILILYNNHLVECPFRIELIWALEMLSLCLAPVLNCLTPRSVP